MATLVEFDFTDEEEHADSPKLQNQIPSSLDNQMLDPSADFFELLLNFDEGTQQLQTVNDNGQCHSAHAESGGGLIQECIYTFPQISPLDHATGTNPVGGVFTTTLTADPDAIRKAKKRANDKRYHENKKQKKTQMESELKMLNDGTWSLKCENDNLKRDYENLKHENESLKQYNISQAKMTDELRSDLDRSESKYKEQTVLLQTLSEQLPNFNQMEAKIGELTVENDGLRHANQKLKCENQSLTSFVSFSFEKQRIEIKDLTDETGSLKGECESLRREIEDYKNNEINSGDVGSLKRENEVLKQDNVSQAKRIDELTSDLDKSEVKYKEQKQEALVQGLSQSLAYSKLELINQKLKLEISQLRR